MAKVELLSSSSPRRLTIVSEWVFSKGGPSSMSRVLTLHAASQRFRVFAMNSGSLSERMKADCNKYRAFLLGPPITSAHRRTNLSIIHSTAPGRDRGRNMRAMTGLAKGKGSSPTQTNHRLRSNLCFQLNSEYCHVEHNPQ